MTSGRSKHVPLNVRDAYVFGTGNGSAQPDVSRVRGPWDEEASGSVKKAKRQRGFWQELPILVVIALLLALLIKTFLVQAFLIPSDSMQDTLQRGDRVLVDKLTPWFGSEPERGEVVVFHDPGGWLDETPPLEPNVVQRFLSFIGLMPSAEEKDLIKRVIAVGGDTVECHGTGPVKVNGKALKEDSYLYPGNTPCGDKAFGPVKVPKGSIWVMGDHRQKSQDSRYHTNLKGNGTVETKQVVGRAFTIAWPINRWSWLPVPDTFDQPALNKAVAAAPAALGLAGAVPITVWRRRRRTARAAEPRNPASNRTDGRTA
ncbi:signal peptidase I [Streptomyces platensis]|uniref:signal peptidase I n=1 Tax=Streptomyces platensis TaxID=58346 RepID=UPI002E259E26|nr:signal peptidase I [Streptomyces platensis]